GPSGDFRLGPLPFAPRCGAQPGMTASVLGALSRRDLDALAAAARAGLVRIVEDKPRAQLFLHEIQFGADQEQDGLGIDEDLHALVFHHFLEGLGLRGIFHGVAHAGAAAIGDAHAHALHLAVGLGHDLAKARRRGLAQLDRLGAFTAGLFDLRFHQNMFSSSLASSLMRSGVQGGSKVMFTVTSPMPSTVSSAALTLPGISPATGQLGAVRVMSTATSLLSATSTL